ncbi:MAG: lipopolysaccharide heptosyltransferase II [Cytophagaceae bacterium]|jgi:heptosyltransferase-2|nr:lipopolysaccharide heptosyltransferase II [Cytophagaceae bacterium]
MKEPSRLLVIQTAFIGDVILATALIESLHQAYPHATLDLVVRQGNEILFQDHPYIHKVWVWNKKKQKFKHLLQLGIQLRKEKYDISITLQRFFSTGLLSAIANAQHRIGFHNNPLSFLFTKKVAHRWGSGVHEVSRNFDLIADLPKVQVSRPVLYPSAAIEASVQTYTHKPFICIAPASVWFTKQWPEAYWSQLIQMIPTAYTVYVVGGPGDTTQAQRIVQTSGVNHVVVVTGTFSLMESAALFQKAAAVIVNDSGPLHIASAMNTPTVAVFCSTVPSFGFGPLSTRHRTVETMEQLDCRPCGMHGKKECPLGHFTCGTSITPKMVYTALTEVLHEA